MEENKPQASTLSNILVGIKMMEEQGLVHCDLFFSSAFLYIPFVPSSRGISSSGDWPLLTCPGWARDLALELAAATSVSDGARGSVPSASVGSVFGGGQKRWQKGITATWAKWGQAARDVTLMLAGPEPAVAEGNRTSAKNGARSMATSVSVGSGVDGGKAVEDGL
eukprot:g31758.t1